MSDEFDMDDAQNPNESGEESIVENSEEESIKEEVIPKQQKPKAAKESNKLVSIKVEELEDFLAEANRVGTIFENTRKDLQEIKNSTNIVQSLQQIADMDLLKFQNKFESAIQNLDLQAYAREAIKESLSPIVAEYKDSNQLLKNLIFELERRFPEGEKEKPKSKVKFFIAAAFIVVISVVGYFYSIQNSINSTPNNTSKQVKIFIKAGKKILKIKEDKFVSSSNNLTLKAQEKKGYFYFEKGGTKYKIHNSKVRKIYD